MAGAVTLVWRGGEVVQAAAVGWRDVEARAPLQRDTIFRIASMTKPITSAAALMLMRGRRASRWRTRSRAGRRSSPTCACCATPDGPLGDTEPAERQITFDDLLTHRSGLTYGDFHSGPIAAAYAEALGGDIDSHVPPDDWIAGLAALPLIDQPGAGFHYGRSTDLLGLLIARIEDAPLGEVLERRIFGPLGMRDTGFTVPPAKRGRRAAAARLRRAGPPHAAAHRARRRDPGRASRRHGLRLGRPGALVDGRRLPGLRADVRGRRVDGVRLLRPQTLALMTANRLTEDQRADARMLGMPVFTGHGFGLGVAVVLDPDKAMAVRGKGGVGTVGWPGAYGGLWQADPTDGSVMVLLQHNMVDLEQMAKGYGLAGYGAIMEFHALASATLSGTG